MFRSLSTHSSNSMNNQLNTTTNELLPPAATAAHRRLSIPCDGSIKKAFSLIFNKAHFSHRIASDDCEMHEFIGRTSSENNLNTLQRSESNLSGDTTVHEQSSVAQATCPRQQRYGLSIHRTLSQIRDKIRSCRHEYGDDNEKNHGFLEVKDADGDLVLIQDDAFNHQETRHAEACVQVSNNDHIDDNQIQFRPTVSDTPDLAHSVKPFSGLYGTILDSRCNNAIDLQSTRSSIECGVPQADLPSIHDTQIPQVISASSTNSSTHEYVGIDRSTLDDHEYVRAQQLDLEHLTILEIKLSEKHSDLRADLQSELEFIDLYEEALKMNSTLKEELRTLQEEYDLIYSPWSCKVCTLNNESYDDTHCDVCEVCGGPSPLKEAALTR